MLIQGMKRDGTSWIPKFVESINQLSCMGCGRCYKVCGHEVLNLIDPPEDIEDEKENMVMTIIGMGNCIGCESCNKVCTKKCFSFNEVDI